MTESRSRAVEGADIIRCPRGAAGWGKVMATRLLALLEGEDVRIVRGAGDTPIDGLTDDSRDVTGGSLFILRDAAGERAADYAAAAVAAGAAAVLHGPGVRVPALPDHVVEVVTAGEENIDQVMAGRIARRYFGDPASRLKLIGITGTNGKTTTAMLVQHLLEYTGVRTGIIGTVFTDTRDSENVGRSRRPAALTTPGAVGFTRLLAEMVANGCQAAVAEVSSHALDQGRVAGQAFHAGVFTNLSGDHLDYHGTVEAYADAKSLLFRMLDESAWAVINEDDPRSGQMVGATAARVVLTTVQDGPAVAHDAATVRGGFSATAFIEEVSARHSRVGVVGPWGSTRVDLPLVGRFNVSNAIQAVAASHTVTDLSRSLRGALVSLPQVPGRLERVIVERRAGGAPTVLVDYAHTDDALANALSTLRPLTTGRLSVVVGCGGDRDRTKRPRMAKVAVELADRAWLTSDNPRTEDPAAILDDMLAGVPASAADRVRVIEDRAAAIGAAVADAEPGDTVLIAGKGHEDYQLLPDGPPGARTVRKVHFDDREQAAAALGRWHRDRPTPLAAAG